MIIQLEKSKSVVFLCGVWRRKSALGQRGRLILQFYGGVDTGFGASCFILGAMEAIFMSILIILSIMQNRISKDMFPKIVC